MKRLFSAFVLGSMFLPSLASAQALTDVYGDLIFAQSASNILFADRATGGPDGQYADFRAKDAYLTIDMGEGEEGFNDLIITMKIFDLNAVGRATLYDKDWNVLTTSFPAPFSVGQTSWIIPYSGETPYRYVKIESTDTKQWSVDAVQATQVSTPAPVVTEPAVETIPYCTFADCGRAGDILKSPDSSSVYFIGLDGKRHTFPNGATLTSWSYSFDQIFGLIADQLTNEQLAVYPIGRNMTVRPGTYMVKIVHDPKVYAVEPGGVLRWVVSETVATELYGDDWNKQIIDIDETFWKNYTVGTPITDSFEPPVGYYFIDHDNHYIVTKDGARPLNAEEVTALRLDAQFAGSYEVAALNATPGLADNSDLSVFVEAY
ncbi:MAG: hypothetical protein WC813_00015 [Patescibacteria group bacterium]|jgi:hypothetical protein